MTASATFTKGKQPCADFKPQREGNGDNVHECFGPFDDIRPERLRFVWRCYWSIRCGMFHYREHKGRLRMR